MTDNAQSIGKRSGGFYPVTTSDGELHRYISATTVLGAAVAKQMLPQWAASLERKQVLQAAGSLYDYLRSVKDDYRVTKPGFEQALLERLNGFAHRRVFKEAGLIGSCLHEQIEWRLRGMMNSQPKIIEGAEKCIASWETWLESVNLKPKYLEFAVYSQQYEHAGRLDYYGEYNGETVIADWKSGSGIYPEALLQVVSYREAFVEMQPDLPPPTKAIIVRFPKSGEPAEVVVVTEEMFKPLYNAFLSALNLWKYLHLGAAEYASNGNGGSDE